MKVANLALLFFSAALIAQTPEITAWAYQLQNIDIELIETATDFDLIVIDYSSDGLESGEWSHAEISTIKSSGKTAVAYISIGEAEDYRWYWNPEWESTPPPWLGPENPDWEGNYKVRFWHEDWQNLVFDYLDRIIEQGFDGVYLDIVDAYYYWMVEDPEELFADTLMIHFIECIDSHVDSIAGCDIYVFPQNAESIIDEENITTSMKERYFSAINGIGSEDLFFTGPANENNPLEPDDYRIGLLDSFVHRGELVLSVEYLTLPGLIDVYLDSTFYHSFIPYASRRDLDTLYSGLPASIYSQRSLPADVSLHAHPNPFNSAVTISIDIPVGDGSPVPFDIEIFDVNGRKIAQLPVGEGLKPSRSLVTEQAGGSETTPLRNAQFIWRPDESLGSGVYLVRANIVGNGGHTEESVVKRVVYLK